MGGPQLRHRDRGLRVVAPGELQLPCTALDCTASGKGCGGFGNGEKFEGDRRQRRSVDSLGECHALEGNRFDGTGANLQVAGYGNAVSGFHGSGKLGRQTVEHLHHLRQLPDQRLERAAFRIEVVDAHGQFERYPGVHRGGPGSDGNGNGGSHGERKPACVRRGRVTFQGGVGPQIQGQGPFGSGGDPEGVHCNLRKGVTGVIDLDTTRIQRGGAGGRGRAHHRQQTRIEFDLREQDSLAVTGKVVEEEGENLFQARSGYRGVVGPDREGGARFAGPQPADQKGEGQDHPPLGKRYGGFQKIAQVVLFTTVVKIQP